MLSRNRQMHIQPDKTCICIRSLLPALGTSPFRSWNEKKEKEQDVVNKKLTKEAKKAKEAKEARTNCPKKNEK